MPQHDRRPELIRDEPVWQYRDSNGQPVSRRLRVWRTGPGRLTAVVTERGTGMSITNTAEQVVLEITAEYPDDVVETIEHYPAGQGADRREHFDSVEVVNGQPRWKHIPLQTMLDRFGPDVLDDEPPAPAHAVPPRPLAPRTPPVTGAPPADEVIFRGHPGGLVTVEDPDGEQFAVLQHLVRHSPDGFSWGYHGSGPAELARCLLIAALGEQALCPECAGTGLVAYDPHADADVPFDPQRHDLDLASRCWCGDGIRNLPHQAFKSDRVARWQQDQPWYITAGELRAWLARCDGS